MQKDKPTTPTMRRTQAFARPRTPDRLDAAVRARNRGQVRSGRATMAPTDFALPGAPVPRRAPGLNMTRTSVMSSNQLDCTRRVDVETNNNNELGLLYDKYLQSLVEKHILKKKVDEREKVIATQLTALAKEQEQSDQKLHEIKMKTFEVSMFSEIQKNVESQIKEMTALLKTYQGKPVETIGHIQSLLKSLDTLTCRDVIIPTTKEETDKLMVELEQIKELLVVMNSTIGDKGRTLNEGSQGVKSFIQTHENLVKHVANLEDAIENVQIEVLKTLSATLLPYPDHTLYN